MFGVFECQPLIGHSLVTECGDNLVERFLFDSSRNTRQQCPMNPNFTRLSLFIVTWLLLMAIACSKRDGAASSAGATTMQIDPGVGVGPIKFGMNMDDVGKAIGPPTRITGRAQEYLNLGIAVLPSGDGGVGAVMIGDLEGGTLSAAFKGTTKEGVGIGSTHEKIVTALGPPEKSETTGPDVERLRYNSGRTIYTLKRGKVVHIEVKR